MFCFYHEKMPASGSEVYR